MYVCMYVYSVSTFHIFTNDSVLCTFKHNIPLNVVHFKWLSNRLTGLMVTAIIADRYLQLVYLLTIVSDIAIFVLKRDVKLQLTN